VKLDFAQNASFKTQFFAILFVFKARYILRSNIRVNSVVELLIYYCSQP